MSPEEDQDPRVRGSSSAGWRDWLYAGTSRNALGIVGVVGRGDEPMESVNSGMNCVVWNWNWMYQCELVVLNTPRQRITVGSKSLQQ